MRRTARTWPAVMTGALVAALALGAANIAASGSSVQSAKTKPAKLKVVHVFRELATAPFVVSNIYDVRCPKGYRVSGGSVSPGANDVAVDGPAIGREGWSGAVGNPNDFTAHWSIEAVCIKGLKRLKITRGKVAQRAGQSEMLRELRRAAPESHHKGGPRFSPRGR
jgi:hypothetical protein